MKAISLTQPWASLVVTGEKRIETRSWKLSQNTQFPFTLAVHAAKGFSTGDKMLASSEPFGSALKKHGISWFNELPLGAIIGTVEGTDFRFTQDVRDYIEPQELAFGDYSNGRYAWLLSNPRSFAPIPLRGALKLFNIPAEIETEINNGRD